MSGLGKLWVWFQKAFRTPTEFERYIASRRPQNPADLEILIKEWEYRQVRQSY